MPRRPFSEITLKTKDNVKISANHYKKGFDKILIICPGFLMHKDSKPFLKLSKRLSRHFDVITLNFRGHGNSEGRYAFTSKEGRDLRVVIDYSAAKYKNIGIIGFSLGAAIAINETARHKAVDRLMAVSAPTEFKKIENRFLNVAIIASTFKKLDWKMGQLRLGNPLLKKSRPIDNVAKISPIPILFVHGGKDTIITPKHTRSLYKKAKDPKRLVIFDDCLHAEDIFFGDNFENFISLCIEWFK